MATKTVIRTSLWLAAFHHEGAKNATPPEIGDAIKAAIATGKPCLIDANIGADLNPGGAGVWELPGHGTSRPFIGGRYEPGAP